MNKRFIISIEEMEKPGIGDSIADWLFELEENKKIEEQKNQKNKNSEHIEEIKTLQKRALKELSFKRLANLAVIFSKLEEKDHKKVLNLSDKIKAALNEKWEEKIRKDKEEVKEK